MNIEHFDVVVVGLGPVGAVVANLLGARGVRTLVVERDPQINRAPRAITAVVERRASSAILASYDVERRPHASATLGWAAVVRPDRMVLCEGPVHDSPRLVEETLGLLDAPRTTLQQRSTPERARKDMP